MAFFLFTDLKIARLFTFGGGFETFLLVCEFFILLFFGVFIYQEAETALQTTQRLLQRVLELCGVRHDHFGVHVCWDVFHAHNARQPSHYQPRKQPWKIRQFWPSGVLERGIHVYGFVSGVHSLD